MLKGARKTANKHKNEQGSVSQWQPKSKGTISAAAAVCLSLIVVEVFHTHRLPLNQGVNTLHGTSHDWQTNKRNPNAKQDHSFYVDGEQPVVVGSG